MKHVKCNTTYAPGSCCRFGSVGKDTEILTADGRAKPARCVCIGDMLLSRGEKIIIVQNVITGYERKMVMITTQSGSVLLTEDHIVCTLQCSRHAGSIQPGDILLGWNSNHWKEEHVTVVSVKIVEYSDHVYNFDFFDTALFVGNGLFLGDVNDKKICGTNI